MLTIFIVLSLFNTGAFVNIEHAESSSVSPAVSRSCSDFPRNFVVVIWYHICLLFDEAENIYIGLKPIPLSDLWGRKSDLWIDYVIHVNQCYFDLILFSFLNHSSKLRLNTLGCFWKLKVLGRQFKSTPRYWPGNSINDM